MGERRNNIELEIPGNYQFKQINEDNLNQVTLEENLSVLVVHEYLKNENYANLARILKSNIKNM